MQVFHSDILVIGSGLAGLSFALKASEHSKVKVLSKETLGSTNTSMAQGGIAAVMSEEDSFDSHIQDTLTAGAGLCHQDVVSEFVSQAPERIKDLLNWGVQFDLKSGTTDEISLTREGGHSFRRILHHEDQTGREIHARLLALAQANPKIEFIENEFAIDLILNKQINPFEMDPSRCVGAYSLNTQTGFVSAYLAKATILATGGAGKVYLYTSNWSGATGDGIAMAYRAGARVGNLEFMQFHPTCLYHPESRNFLISEALRGEGGELVNAKNEPFMKKHHPMGSLAPRDIVARGIDAEMKATGAPCVYLDMRMKSKEFLQNRFPAIFQKCLEFGIDMSEKPIPVVPAAHYLCGGVIADKNGQTDIVGLFALGETACTGFHGANRLASNSLLECLTTAHNCAQKIKSTILQTPLAKGRPPDWIEPEEMNSDENIVISHMWDEIRRLMWNYVGIVRSNKRLERAHSRLINIQHEVKDYYSHLKLNRDILELRNIALVADLSVKCARKRKESRGIHFNLDFPHRKDSTPTGGKDTILIRGIE